MGLCASKSRSGSTSAQEQEDQKPNQNIVTVGSGSEKKSLERPAEMTFSASDRIEFHIGKFVKDYTLVSYLSKGGFGQVGKVQHNFTNQFRAVKYITKDPNNENQKKELVNELSVLKYLVNTTSIVQDHPNIVKLLDFYEDQKYYYLVMELCTGGELLDKLVECKHFGELQASKVMFQLLSALNYLHSQQITHRDIKPENLLFDNKNPDSPLKLIDFGISVRKNHHPIIQNKPHKGTVHKENNQVYYMAPEAVKDGIATDKCDIWACGVLLYFLLSGQLPFKGKDDDQTKRAIMRGTFDLTSSVCKFILSNDQQEWNKVSKEAKFLITRLLQFNPAQRPSAVKCLKDSWFVIKRQEKTDICLTEALSTMREFKTSQALQQATLMYIVNLLATNEEKLKLMETFQQLDGNNDGQLSKEELYQGYKVVMGDIKAQQEVDRIFDIIDQNHSGKLDYSEFVMATIDKKKLLTKQNLMNTFKSLDRDGSGSITIKEVKTLLGGAQLKREVWEDMVAEVDINKDGRISLNEFVTMMQSLLE